MPDEIKREFVLRIEGLRAKISNRYDTLNLEAIWLFVATLGCWSVYQPIIQMIAILLVLLFFSSKVLKDQKYDSTFSQLLKEIRSDVDASILEEDIKKARLYDLDEIDKKLLGLHSIYKSTPIFLMGYGFWALSLMAFGYRLFYAPIA